MASSEYAYVINFSLNIRKQYNTINAQIWVYNRYRKQYITKNKNFYLKSKFSPKNKDNIINQNGGLFEYLFCQKHTT